MIGKYLDLSTAHLRDSERERIDSNPGAVPAVRVIEHEWGWWVNVPSTEMEDALVELREDGYDDLARIIEHARRADCNWVNLDADAEQEPGLTTYVGEHSLPPGEDEDDVPHITTWADGFGTWHARLPFGEYVDPEHTARDAIQDELMQRNDAGPDYVVNVRRRPELDEPGRTLVYVEDEKAIDVAAVWTCGRCGAETPADRDECGGCGHLQGE